MKRSISIWSAVTIVVIALTTALLISSCQKEARNQSQQTLPDKAELAARSAPLKLELKHFTQLLEDENMNKVFDGNLPDGDATLLYNTRGHVPVMTPDGMHHVSLGEFNMISGTAQVKCINSGTHVVMHLKGLIPNGVYTIWTLAYKDPGFDGVSIPLNRIGFGALGAIEGNKNSNAFVADDEGTASISVIRAAGKLGIDAASGDPHPDYRTPNCLADVFETHLALAYHLNNMPAAPGPGPTWVVQGYFQFWGSQL